MYGIVYLTECITESCECYGVKYIGQHKTETLEDDGYLGSGKLLVRYLDKYGRDKFRRSILRVCDSKEDLDYWERYYIEESDAMNSPEYLNLHEGGSGGWQYYNNSPHEHPRGMLGKSQTDYQRSNQSAMMKGNKLAVGNKNHLGIPLSEETRNKLSESLKGKPAYNKGIPMKEEQKRLISELKLKYYRENPEAKRIIGELASKRNTGRVWITNGVEDKYIVEENLSLYEGYRLGRSTISNKSKVGTVFITDGASNRQIKADESIPHGWRLGMTKRSGWKKKVKNSED